MNFITFIFVVYVKNNNYFKRIFSVLNQVHVPGMRFAKMPMVTALLAIFKDYRIETTERTPKSFDFEPRAISTQPLGGIYLKFLSRN